MKMVRSYAKTFIIAVVMTASLGFMNCKNNQKPENPKEVAEEHYDAKFNAENKEKDAQFLVNAAEINLKKIRLGKLAQQVSPTIDVKDLGRQMEEAHSKSLNDLTELAKKKLITIPIPLTDDTQGDYKKLVNKDIKNFDKEYCDMMVNGHKDAISLFEKASTESSDEEIRKWAANTLPNLRVHLDHAMTCQKKYEKM